MRQLGWILGGWLFLTGALSASPCEESALNSEHSVRIGQTTVSYTATVGYLRLPAPDGKGSACLFYTAYRRTNLSQPGRRPLIFAFNGGPGSASLYVHLGLFGPKRADTGPEGLDRFSPFRLVANDYSPLDIADLVLLDPAGTGYSQVSPGTAVESFFGAKADAEATALFIQRFLSVHSRWDSPVFIAGESYGGTRAVMTADTLHREMNIDPAGLVLIAPYLTGGYLDPGYDLSAPLFLPTYAMTAWYHKRLPGQLQKLTPDRLRERAESFAIQSYLRGLVLGTGLSPTTKMELARELAELTGIDSAKLDGLDLRLNPGRFASELLADRRQVVGRYDSRFLGAKISASGRMDANDWLDPSSDSFSPQYTAAINHYFRTELGFQAPHPYVPMKGILKWPMLHDEGIFSPSHTVLEYLSRAMVQNPSLRLYVLSGHYDLAVPYAATIYDLRHLSAGVGLEKRVHHAVYDAGHMSYINVKALAAIKRELVGFVGAQEATPVTPPPAPPAPSPLQIWAARH
jgi:carboxypeptidase C (cathepsin A)